MYYVLTYDLVDMLGFNYYIDETDPDIIVTANVTVVVVIIVVVIVVLIDGVDDYYY